MGDKLGDSRGASLVELALALPLLIMLLIGTVSAAIAYNHQLALSHAARDAGRYAATLPVNNFSSLNDWLDNVAARTVEEATGSLDPGTPDFEVCVAYVSPGTGPDDTTTSRVDNGSTVSYSSTPCFADFTTSPTNEGRRVQIRAGRTTDFSVVFWSRDVSLSAEGVNRFEAALGS